MKTITHNQEYKNWLIELKSKIKSSQLKAAVAINSELILMYWELGRQISNKQSTAKWGSGFINQLSADLKKEFPEMSGFSTTNLKYLKKFYEFYKGSISQQPVDQIPWGHNILIFSKSKSKKEAQFYLQKTMENNWSRAVLQYHIETNSYIRQGKAITNFKSTLPPTDSDLANELLKSPYNFEFLSLSERAKEKELEDKLVQNISQFLLELGKGFAYMGRQFLLKVGNKDYRTDLLFFHTKLKCYIVIELKLTEFQPEFIGKLNFYISAINEIVKEPEDKPTLGILLCKNKDNFEVEFSLKDINKPIGVSDFTYKELPKDIKEAIPSVEEFNKELKKINS